MSMGFGGFRKFWEFRHWSFILKHPGSSVSIQEAPAQWTIVRGTPSYTITSKRPQWAPCDPRKQNKSGRCPTFMDWKRNFPDKLCTRANHSVLLCADYRAIEQWNAVSIRQLLSLHPAEVVLVLAIRQIRLKQRWIQAWVRISLQSHFTCQSIAGWKRISRNIHLSNNSLSLGAKGGNCPCASDQPALLFSVRNDQDTPQDLSLSGLHPQTHGTCLGDKLHKEKIFLELTKPHEDKPRLVIKNSGKWSKI